MEVVIKVSMSENVAEEVKKKVYFHGKDIYSKKFLKKIHKKPKLTCAILINAAIILISILIILIFII